MYPPHFGGGSGRVTALGGTLVVVLVVTTVVVVLVVEYGEARAIPGTMMTTATEIRANHDPDIDTSEDRA
jgi:hypothetical protein